MSCREVLEGGFKQAGGYMRNKHTGAVISDVFKWWLQLDCRVVSPEGGRLCYQNIQDQLLRQNQMIQLEDPDQTETVANGENVQQLSADILASYFLFLSKQRGNLNMM